VIAGPVLIAGFLEGIGRGLGNVNLLIDLIPSALDVINLDEHLLELLLILLLSRDALVGVGDGVVDVLELRLGGVKFLAKPFGGL
jgi:spore maturation protein SpmB